MSTDDAKTATSSAPSRKKTPTNRRRKQNENKSLVPSAAVVNASVLRANANEYTPITTQNQKETTEVKKSARKRTPREPKDVISKENTINEKDKKVEGKESRRTRGNRNQKTENHSLDIGNDLIELDDEEKASLDLCLLCTEPFKYHAIGECNHAGICSTCSMRMRMLMKDLNCPICKQLNPRVIVTDIVAPYNTFGIWGDTGGPGVILDDRSDMFFSRCQTHFDALVSRRDYVCRRCPKNKRIKYRALEDLQLHMENDHATYFCDLCVQHEHFFIAEYPLFSMRELMAHQTTATHAASRERHPLCEFCHVRYYSDVELHNHLERDHFKCHLCPNNQHRYYRNYKNLEGHFRREHFLCDEPSCLAKGFIVFSNDIDYQAHTFGTHGTTDNRIRVAFTVRRGMEADNAPHVTGSSDTWEFVGPPPAAVRQEEDFPALPATTPTPMQTPPRPIVRPPPTIQLAAAPIPTPIASVPRAVLSRNAQLAAAFGRGPKTDDAMEKKMKPQYSEELRVWGRTKFRTLVAVEKKIEDMMNDRSCFSTHLKAMPRDMRRMIHELAVFYGLKSEARDAEPQRFISLYKLPTSALPLESLSKTLLEESQGPKKQTRRARVYVDRNAKLPVGRGWEKVSEVVAAPQSKEIPSEDEEETIEDLNAFVQPQGSSTRLEFLRRVDAITSDNEAQDD